MGSSCLALVASSSNGYGFNAESLGALPLTGMTPGGQDKGSTQRSKAGGDHKLIRTDHRARSLKSMNFLSSQTTPNAAASAAIAGQHPFSCQGSAEPHRLYYSMLQYPIQGNALVVRLQNHSSSMLCFTDMYKLSDLLAAPSSSPIILIWISTGNSIRAP